MVVVVVVIVAVVDDDVLPAIMMSHGSWINNSQAS